MEYEIKKTKSELEAKIAQAKKSCSAYEGTKDGSYNACLFSTDFFKLTNKLESIILDEYYSANETEVEDAWQEHLYTNDWGSGDDKINITDAIFWEFVEDYMIVNSVKAA